MERFVKTSFVMMVVAMLATSFCGGCSWGGEGIEQDPALEDFVLCGAILKCTEGEVCNSQGICVKAGPQGEVGPQGPQGEVGPQGPQGEVGPQGPQGEVGPQGPQGEVGPQGPQGEVGPQGPQGEVGPQGPQGEVGPQGPQGEVGPQGPQGEVGPQGPQGEVGPQGPQGEVGPQGEAGRDGADGSDGRDGVDGSDGADGKDGQDGKDFPRCPYEHNCEINETCNSQGVCIPQAVECKVDLDCDDGEEYTVDTCEHGKCHHKWIECLSDEECQDTDLCNGTEKCVKGKCVDGVQLVCEFHCDPDKGCVNCLTDLHCDDVDPDTLDKCQNGECVHNENLIQIKVECVNSCEPHIYYKDQKDWRDWFPSDNQKKIYSHHFRPSEICNFISTYNENGEDTESILGFELGVRDTTKVSMPWYGEPGAPAIDKYSVFIVEEEASILLDTVVSRPPWSSAPLKQADLAEYCQKF